VSLPAPTRRVVTAPAVDEVVAGAADDPVITVAAAEGEAGPLCSLEASITSLPASPLMTSESFRFDTVDRHLSRQSVDDNRGAAADDADLIVAGRAIDNHGVSRAVALAAVCVQTGRCNLLDVGAGGR
jgi:hypothetical protein